MQNIGRLYRGTTHVVALYAPYTVILSGYIQTRWRTSGPTDAVYNQFLSSLPSLFDQLDTIVQDSKKSLDVIVPNNLSLSILSLFQS